MAKHSFIDLTVAFEKKKKTLTAKVQHIFHFCTEMAPFKIETLFVDYSHPFYKLKQLFILSQHPNNNNNNGFFF